MHVLVVCVFWGFKGPVACKVPIYRGRLWSVFFLPPPPRGGPHSYSDSLLDLEALGHFSILCLKIAFIFLPSDPRSETRLCSTVVRRGM